MGHAIGRSVALVVLAGALCSGLRADDQEVEVLGRRAKADAGDIASGRVWYDASSSGSDKGLPVVETPGSGDFAVPEKRIPWSSTYWPLVECGLAFERTSNGLSPLETYDSISSSE